MANGQPDPSPPVIDQQQPPLPASVAQAPPQNQPQLAPQPAQQATAPEPPQHHNALAGVLAAIAGPDITHTVDPQTGKITTTATPPTPGNAFRKILAGALTGMGAGAAAGSTGHPGAGILGGIGAGGSAVMAQQRGIQQQDIENQQKQFDEQQKAQLNKATIAHLNAEGSSYAWQAARYQAEANEKTQKMAFDLGEKMAENPNNKDYGTYASWDDFLQKHPEIAPDMAEQQGGGNLIKHNVYGTDGKVEGVHVYKYDPGWMNQTNAEPFTFAVPGGPGQEDRTFTVPAHSMKMSDIWKSATSLETQELKSAIPKSDRGRHVQDYLQAHNLPDTAANRLLGEADYDRQTKVTPAIVIQEAKDRLETTPQTVDPFGAAITPITKKGELEKRSDKFSTDYIKDIVQMDRGYQQMQGILDDIRKTGQVTGPESLVALFDAVGISSAPLKGRGLRIGKDIIGQHEQTRGLLESMRRRLEAVSTGEVITQRQIEEYAKILQDTRRDMYVSAGDEAIRQGLARNFMPRGHGAAIDPPTAEIFLRMANGDKDVARRVAQQYGWGF